MFQGMTEKHLNFIFILMNVLFYVLIYVLVKYLKFPHEEYSVGHLL